MAHVTAWFAKLGNGRTTVSVPRRRHKSMIWMMSMFHANKTSCAEIIVVADGTGVKVFLEKHCDKLSFMRKKWEGGFLVVTCNT